MAATLYFIALAWNPIAAIIDITGRSSSAVSLAAAYYALQFLYNIGLITADIAASYAVWSIGRQILHTLLRQKYGLNPYRHEV
jgi:hypothetical protein